MTSSKEIPYTIVFPDDFDDEAPIIESKGWFSDFSIIVGDRVLKVTVYDPVHLAQECEDEIRSDGFKAESAILIIPSVTRENIESAVAALALDGFAVWDVTC